MSCFDHVSKNWSPHIHIATLGSFKRRWFQLDVTYLYQSLQSPAKRLRQGFTIGFLHIKTRYVGLSVRSHSSISQVIPLHSCLHVELIEILSHKTLFLLELLIIDLLDGQQVPVTHNRRQKLLVLPKLWWNKLRYGLQGVPNVKCHGWYGIDPSQKPSRFYFFRSYLYYRRKSSTQNTQVPHFFLRWPVNW